MNTQVLGFVMSLIPVTAMSCSEDKVLRILSHIVGIQEMLAALKIVFLYAKG